MKTSQKTRFLSLILALVLSFSLCPFALADLDPSDYSDVSEDHWAYDSIMYCSKWNIVTGFEDGTFRPEDQVTYAQFIAMLARTFYADEVSAVTSITGNPWYYPYMRVACNHNLHVKTNIVNLGGWPEVVVADDPVNRYEMAQALANTGIANGKAATAAQSGAAQAAIKDYNSVPTTYKPAVKYCYALGIISGMTDGSFAGEQTMTRAQACVVITRMKDVINSETPATPSQPQQPTQPETPPQPQQPETPEQTTTGTLANGQPITEDNVLSILADIQKEYPDGMAWGDYGPNYYKGPVGTDVDTLNKQFKVKSGSGTTYALLNYGCGGFMAMVSVRIFGESGAPCREVTDPSKVRPGDIVVKVDPDNPNIARHYGVARGNSYKNNTGFWCIPRADGNNSDMVNWSGNFMVSRPNVDSFAGSYRVFTRYPD